MQGSEKALQVKKYTFGDIPTVFEHKVVKASPTGQEMAHWQQRDRKSVV